MTMGQMRIVSRRSRHRCCVSSRMSERAIRYCAVSMLSSDRYESVIIEAHGLLTTVAMTELRNGRWVEAGWHDE
jgi:hypothetical protein